VQLEKTQGPTATAIRLVLPRLHAPVESRSRPW
jgi:hypothetical protein